MLRACTGVFYVPSVSRTNGRRYWLVAESISNRSSVRWTRVCGSRISTRAQSMPIRIRGDWTVDCLKRWERTDCTPPRCINANECGGSADLLFLWDQDIE